MYEWQVFPAYSADGLRIKLNSITESGWEVYQVVQIFKFQDYQIKFLWITLGRFSTPSEIEFEIIARRKNGIQEG